MATALSCCNWIAWRLRGAPWRRISLLSAFSAVVLLLLAFYPSRVGDDSLQRFGESALHGEAEDERLYRQGEDNNLASGVARKSKDLPAAVGRVIDYNRIDYNRAGNDADGGSDTLKYELPRIVMIFFTYNGVQNPEIWQAWYDDFYDHLVSRGWADDIPQTTNDFFDPGRHEDGVMVEQARAGSSQGSGNDAGALTAAAIAGFATNRTTGPPPLPRITPYLRSFVSYHYLQTREDVIKGLPKWMRYGVITNPPEARWGRLTGLMHETFRQALQRYPDGEFFLTISDSTIPIKPAKDIWAAVAADPRTRIQVMCPEHSEKVPKASQWTMFNRVHLETMVSDKVEEWYNLSRLWRAGKCARWGASDELYPIRALLKARYLNKDSSPLCFPRGRANETWRYSEVTQSFDQRLKFNTLGPVATTTFIDWNFVGWPWQNIGVKRRYTTHPLPRLFLGLNGDLLRVLEQSPFTWFLRKVEPNTVVYNSDAESGPSKNSFLTLNSDLAVAHRLNLLPGLRFTTPNARGLGVFGTFGEKGEKQEHPGHERMAPPSFNALRESLKNVNEIRVMFRKKKRGPEHYGTTTHINTFIQYLWTLTGI